MNTVRRPRRLALAAAALGLALAASGCSYFSAVQTHDFYEAADGTQASLYQADGMQLAGVRNAILVQESPERTVLYASVVNYLAEPVTVELTGKDGDTVLFSTSIEVPAGGSVQISPSSAQSVSVSQPTTTGTIVSLEVAAEGQEETVSLPITGTSLEHFAPEADAPAS
ncbi:hypothetical protein [Brachybacterium hainanense]|uniref:DNA modification methylase n=1 Tax=Brachybacterium hainanense TaxID=1541174 RepID=A0ABV6RGD6_9MICO